MTPLDPDDGELRPLVLAPRRIVAFGLTYAGHIAETGSRFDPAAPTLFEKAPGALLAPTANDVRIPDRAALLQAIARLEPALAEAVERRVPALAAMMDYEVELGLVLLDDVAPRDLADPRAPLPIGFFVANDLTARAVQILGDRAPREIDFWSAAKSFPGFLPVSDAMWVARDAAGDACLRVTLTTRVDGAVRQSSSTMDLVYSPREMLRLAGPLARGDVVLTGTPSGIALRVPRWKRALAGLLLDRVGRLRAAQRSHERFLRAGQVVEVDGGALGRRAVRLVSPSN
jgi:2-keto-4-pentenoate hydratase/2-oxohepta-3-ene-1,7-dioic acid hydratase in catechol pathway